MWGNYKKGNKLIISRTVIENHIRRKERIQISNQFQVNPPKNINNKDQISDYQQDSNQNPFTAKITFHSFTPPWNKIPLKIPQQNNINYQLDRGHEINKQLNKLTFDILKEELNK